MKDIIQTRNSFKKKHRLSAQSDDIQIDVELCSDNEEVFEEEDEKQKLKTSSPNTQRRISSSEVPIEIIRRYQQQMDDGTVLYTNYIPIKFYYLISDPRRF